MEQASAKLTKLLVMFVIGILVIKSAGNAGFFTPKSYKGRGYYVKIPEGWKKAKKEKGVRYPVGVTVAMFVPKEIDLKREDPDSTIMIITKKLTTPIWIEDEFPEILASIQRQGHRVMDKGEIKLDEVISKWLVYHDRKMPALVLEFYMVTDNSVFYKIQYSAPPEKFNVLRKSFEELKESFKFRFSLY